MNVKIIIILTIIKSGDFTFQKDAHTANFTVASFTLSCMYLMYLMYVFIL